MPIAVNSRCVFGAVLLLLAGIGRVGAEPARGEPARPLPKAAEPAAPIKLAPFEVGEARMRGYYGIAGRDERGPGGISRGCRVRSVYEGTPAAAAGLKPHDLIVAIDGLGPRNWHFTGRVGQQRTLTVERDTGATRTTLTLVVTFRHFSFAGRLGALLGFGSDEPSGGKPARP